MTSTISRFFNRRSPKSETGFPVAGSKNGAANYHVALNKKLPSGLFSFNGKSAMLSFLERVVHFIFSISASLKKTLFEKAEYGMKPVQGGISSKESFNILSHLRLQVLVKMLAITGWNYEKSTGSNKNAFIRKQISWISAFLLMFSINVSAQIAQRGTATTAGNSSTNGGFLTINKPSGVVAGDVMIVSIVQNETDNDNGGLNNAILTGWTLIDGRIIRSDGTSNGNNAWHGTVLR
jgi:hypothetical protein